MLSILLVAVLSTSFGVHAQTFTNPVLYADFADNDIFLGPDGSYYYSASSMHYSPGAPILQSCDLFNWQLIGHSGNRPTPFGPYEYKILNDNIASPVPETGSPVQGSLLETSEGEWYFMSFAWKWFPALVTVDGAWGESYPYPLPEHPLPSQSWTGTDRFTGDILSPAWQWNQNPDIERFTLNIPGLTLHTATVTTDIEANEPSTYL
ncbi:hypothetical protein BDW69DRAFT_188619 [Aspergillus filifer]